MTKSYQDLKSLNMQKHLKYFRIKSKIYYKRGLPNADCLEIHTLVWHSHLKYLPFSCAQCIKNNVHKEKSFLHMNV